jgi:Flp pilus assembly pilin Flp
LFSRSGNRRFGEPGGCGARRDPGQTRCPSASPAEKNREKLMKSFWKNFGREESGQDLIEYTLLMAFVALASASLFMSAGNNINSIWQTSSNTLSNAAVSAS